MAIRNPASRVFLVLMVAFIFQGPVFSAKDAGQGDLFIKKWREWSSSFEVKFFLNKESMDLLHPVESSLDPKQFAYSFHPFMSAPPIVSFTADYRFKPLPNVNLIFFMDAKPESENSFFAYGGNRHGYLDGQFEINMDTPAMINLSARVTLRRETYRLLSADADHIGMPLTNSFQDFQLSSKGNYLYTKERFDLKISSLRTMAIQPRLALALEMTEYNYPTLVDAGVAVDPIVASSTGFSRISKRFYPYVDGGVIFRLADYRLNIDVGGFLHPNNLALSVGNLQSYLQWSGAVDVSYSASKYFTLFLGLRMTQDTYSYDPLWQTTPWSAGEADLTAAARTGEYSDQRNQTVFKTYVGFRIR